MKFASLFILSLFVFDGIAQTPKIITKKSTTLSDIEQIKKLEWEYTRSNIFLDSMGISNILDSTYMLISPDHISNKQQEITGSLQAIRRNIREGIKIDSFYFENMVVHLYDKSAVVTNTLVTKVNRGGTFLTKKHRLFDVFVKRNTEWKKVASQVTSDVPVETISYNQIKARSTLWNTSYNNRDSISFYTLLDSNVIITSGGLRDVGKEECKYICRGLWRRRPDITWNNDQTTIEVNEQWNVAYEGGNWTESWTEKGDTVRSTIKGKYTIMWKKKNEGWLISSAQFIPLSCTGSYCNKRISLSK